MYKPLFIGATIAAGDLGITHEFLKRILAALYAVPNQSFHIGSEAVSLREMLKNKEGPKSLGADRLPMLEGQVFLDKNLYPLIAEIRETYLEREKISPGKISTFMPISKSERLILEITQEIVEKWHGCDLAGKDYKKFKTQRIR